MRRFLLYRLVWRWNGTTLLHQSLVGHYFHMGKPSHEQHMQHSLLWLAQRLIRMGQGTDQRLSISQISEVESLLVKTIWEEQQHLESQQQFLAQLELCLELLLEMKE